MRELPPAVPWDGTAVRPRWTDLPEAVRTRIGALLGGDVVAAVSAGAGFTGGFASMVRTADGRRTFVKAADGATASFTASAYLREAEIVAALPAEVPAPRPQWRDEVAGWSVVGWEAVDGRTPAFPWRPAELTAVLDAVARCAAALSRVPDGLDLRPVEEVLAADFSTWRRAAGGDLALADLDPVAAGRLDELATLESGWARGARGEALVHGDLRPDNTMVTAGGGVVSAWVCDWNWPTVGAGWVDLVCLLPTVHACGGDASALLASHPAGSHAPAAAVDAFLAGLSGFFAEASRRPPFPEASPWLTRHRVWYGAATLSWLAARRGWAA